MKIDPSCTTDVRFGDDRREHGNHNDGKIYRHKEKEVCESKQTDVQVRCESFEKKLCEVSKEQMASPSRSTAAISSDTSPLRFNSKNDSLSPSTNDTSIPCSLGNICHSLKTSHDATCHLESPIFEDHPDTALVGTSTSGHLLHHHFRRLSLHRLPANVPVPSNTLGKCIMNEHFDRSRRTRTVTSSRRSGLYKPLEQDLQQCRRGNFTSPSSATTTSVLINRRKGESAFIHIISAEVVPPSPSAATTKSNCDINSNYGPPSETEVSDDSRTRRDRSEMDLLRVGSTASVKNERRGRSFFRTKDHKRSRARSPGNRRMLENGVGLERVIGSTAIKIGQPRTPWIRRESPSPQPGTRKRTWRRKVISRVERERRAAVREEKNGVAEHIVAELRKDKEAERTNIVGEDENSNLYGDNSSGRCDNSSGRLATWS